MVIDLDKFREQNRVKNRDFGRKLEVLAESLKKAQVDILPGDNNYKPLSKTELLLMSEFIYGVTRKEEVVLDCFFVDYGKFVVD